MAENNDKRSAQMRLIKSKNTCPEIAVRKALYAEGYRYRLHYKSLPGSPDIVFIGKKKAIFINGCFWHRHENCKKNRMPKSNQEYWMNKFSRTIERDLNNQEKLISLDWKYINVWECELKNFNEVMEKIKKFLQ